jgi:hypothetical protein
MNRISCRCHSSKLNPHVLIDLRVRQWRHVTSENLFAYSTGPLQVHGAPPAANDAFTGVIGVIANDITQLSAIPLIP